MEQQSLFENRAGQDMPLATRMRPRTLEEFVRAAAICSARARCCASLIEERPRVLHDFLGAAGRGQNDAGADDRRRAPRPNFINFSAP